MHLPSHFIVLINKKSFPVFRIIFHHVGKNIPCYEFTFYAYYHINSGYET
jgi:hypothetical protein